MTAALLASTTAFLDSYNVANHEMLEDTENLLSLWESNPSSYQDAVSCDVAIDQTSTASSSSMNEESNNVQAVLQSQRDIRNAQAAVRRHRYRQKLKSEREMLRAKCYELSIQLNQLRTAIQEKKTRQTKMLGLSAWKSVATRQKEKRYEAEKTHRKLRSLVSSHLRLISEMNTLLEDRSTRTSVVNLGLLEKPSCCGGRLVIEVYLTELDSSYARTDQIIHDVHFTLAPTLKYNLTKTRSQNVEFFSTASQAYLPFNYANNCRALSRLLLAPGGSNYSNVTLEAENTVAMNYQQNFRPDLDTSKVTSYLVVRRYVCGNRTVFVWRGYLEGIEELNGYRSDETAWLVVYPSVEESNSIQGANSATGTVLQLYLRLVPLHFGVTDCKTNSDRFMTAVVNLCEAELKVTMQLLETSASNIQ